MEIKQTSLNTAENSVLNLLLVPLRVNQLLGVFPLAVNRSNLRLETSWRNYVGTFLVFSILNFSHFFFYTLNIKDLKTVYKITGSTETFISNASNHLSSTFDLICLCIFFQNRFKIQHFYASFLKSVIRILAICYSYCLEEEKVLQNHKKNIIILMRITLVIAVNVAINAVTLYCGKAIDAGMGVGKVVMFFMLSLYWITINHFRMLTFYLWISMIILFKLSFRALGILIKHNEDSSDVCTRANSIFGIISEYREIEGCLKKFHQLFGTQLLNLSFTVVIPLGNVVFQVIKCFQRDDLSSWELSTLASLTPHILSGTITFFILCDAATSMTVEATNCVFNLRQVSYISEMSADEQQNLLSFYTLTILKPPRISPGGFFCLGRHIISPVLGLITTYMIVVLQFRSQEST